MLVSQSGILLFGPGGLRLSALQANLEPLTTSQFEQVSKAKKFAIEQSMKSIMTKQIVQQQQQSNQQTKSLQRHQALVLMCRVYVGSISFEVREEMIKNAFSPYGTIKSISMSWDQVTGKHKGFAFVEYELPEAAQLALEYLNGLQLGSRQIRVGRPSNMPQAKPVIEQIQEECKQNNRIYVSNVHPDLNSQEVSELFEPFGKVRVCKLALTPDVSPPQHRGSGFIEFETEAAATEALTMNNFDLGGTTLHVCRATTPAENVSIYGTLEHAGSSAPTNPVSSTAEEDIQDQLEQANKEQEPRGVASESSGLAKTDLNGYSERSNVSRVIVLKNMVTADDELDDTLQLEVYEECSKHGTVNQVVIYVDKKVKQPQDDPESEPVFLDEVKIFIKYKDGASSERAKEALGGRFFAGRKVSAEHYDVELFRRHIYTQ